MRLLAILVIAALALAGCSDDTEDTSTTTQTGTNGPVGNTTAQVFTGSGTVAASAGTPVVSFQQGGAQLDITVRENATLLFVEVRWDSNEMDLNLHVQEPESEATTWQHTNEGGSPGAPDNPHSITITPGDAGTWVGTWAATVFANGGAANVNFDMAATVFYQEDSVPEGYTAFE